MMYTLLQEDGHATAVLVFDSAAGSASSSASGPAASAIQAKSVSAAPAGVGSALAAESGSGAGHLNRVGSSIPVPAGSRTKIISFALQTHMIAINSKNPMGRPSGMIAMCFVL
jgi:hypothetical protein